MATHGHEPRAQGGRPSRLARRHEPHRRRRRTAGGADEHDGDEERQCVHDERPRRGGDREQRRSEQWPCQPNCLGGRGRQRVRGGEQPLTHQAGEPRGRGRSVRGAQRADDEHDGHDHGRPHVERHDQREHEHQRGACGIEHHHQPRAVEPIDDDPRDRAEQEPWCQAGDDGCCKERAGRVGADEHDDERDPVQRVARAGHGVGQLHAPRRRDAQDVDDRGAAGVARPIHLGSGHGRASPTFVVSLVAPCRLVAAAAPPYAAASVDGPTGRRCGALGRGENGSATGARARLLAQGRGRDGVTDRGVRGLGDGGGGRRSHGLRAGASGRWCRTPYRQRCWPDRWGPTGPREGDEHGHRAERVAGRRIGRGSRCRGHRHRGGSLWHLPVAPAA